MLNQITLLIIQNAGEKDVQDIFLGTGLGLQVLMQLSNRAW